MFSKASMGKTVEMLADDALSMGFDGIDLTCREGGHILPQDASSSLESAIAYLRSRGLSVPMLTSDYTKASQSRT